MKQAKEFADDLPYQLTPGEENKMEIDKYAVSFN